MKTKNTARFILFTLTTLSAVLLSACSAAPATGDNSNLNGSPVTPIIVDTGNSSNSNDANSNDVNSNDANSNDNTNTGSSGNSNDSGIEIFGMVEAITEDTITINGVMYLVPAGFTELKDLVSVGDQVKFQVIFNADGTITILEVEISTGDDNGNDANSNDANSNDDNGNDANSNDDNGNDANSNDDNGNDSNSNDDNGGNDNGSGGGNDDSGGGNDNDGNDDGGGGNDNDDDSNDNG